MSPVSGGADTYVREVPEYLRVVWETAKKKPPPPEAGRYYLPDMRLLVALCCEMQAAAGTGTFFITCRDAGALIGADYHAVSRWLGRLEHDGVLDRRGTGSMGGKANEYRYVGSRGAPQHEPQPEVLELGDQPGTDDRHYREGF
jgi:hypothetical protein